MKEDKPHSATPEATPATPVPASSDVALIHGISSDGAVQVIRRRGEHLEAGALTPLREGAPIQGEVVSLRPRHDCPLLCDVDVHYAPAQRLPSSTPAKSKSSARQTPRRKGPAQVATDTYRDNWDSIWSSRAKKNGDALN